MLHSERCATGSSTSERQNYKTARSLPLGYKVGLLNLAEELGNVSKACQMMGLSRDTVYRYKTAVDDGGVEALLERTRRKPNLANRVDEATEEAVKKSAIAFPAYFQTRTSNVLRSNAS